MLRQQITALLLLAGQLLQPAVAAAHRIEVILLCLQIFFKHAASPKLLTVVRFRQNQLVDLSPDKEIVQFWGTALPPCPARYHGRPDKRPAGSARSEEHTSELQSR